MHTFTTVADDKDHIYFQVGYYSPVHQSRDFEDSNPARWVSLRKCKTVGAALMWVNYLNGGTLLENVELITNRWERGT